MRMDNDVICIIPRSLDIELLKVQTMSVCLSHLRLSVLILSVEHKEQVACDDLY